ncbi:MAG: hypothetical protein Q9181_004375 [Wetmoreana brouardii]
MDFLISYIFILCSLVSNLTYLQVSATPVHSPSAVKKDTPQALRARDPEPPVYNPDGSNISTENWRGTKLFGWKGCDSGAKDIIVETMQDFYKLAQQEALWKDKDWDVPAAKDIWGHATDEKKMLLDNIKPQIKQVFEAAQQVQCSPEGDESNACGDKPPPAKKPECPEEALEKLLCSSDAAFNLAYLNVLSYRSPRSVGKPTGVEVYSNPTERYSKITFCNMFFNKNPSLDYVVNRAKKNPSLQDDLWQYQNRARILFHEITHLNYFMIAPDKVPYVNDVRIEYRIGMVKESELCYGPNFVKVLANYEAVGKGGYFTQRNGTVDASLNTNFSVGCRSVLHFVVFQKSSKAGALFKIKKRLCLHMSLSPYSYPSQPTEERQPSEAPRRDDGQRFFADDDDTVDSDENADENGDDNGDLEAETTNHYVPDCQDHPVMQSSTFGAGTVNDDSTTDCDTNSLSGVTYNVLSGGAKTPSIFDKFCEQIDGTINSKWVVDNHGNQKETAVPGSRMRKRTPPPDPDSYETFNFELSWEKDDANNGCGQNTRSCWNAFAKLADSPCGHQGGEQNGLTAAGRITLPGCGTYAYSITGPDVPKPDQPAPPETTIEPVASPAPAPLDISKPEPPSLPGPASAPDLDSPAC